MWRMNRAPLPFSPVPRIAVLGDSIWTVDGYDTQLNVRNASGDAVRTIELPWEVRPSGKPWSVLEAELRRQDKDMFVQLLADAPRTGEYPSVDGLFVDDGEQIWLKEYNPLVDALWLKRNALDVGFGGVWHVFSPQGRWIASIQMPENFVPLDISENCLLGAERDNLDVERVVVRTVVK